MEKIIKIHEELLDLECDLVVDAQEYYQMYRNYEISPEEYDAKTAEINKQHDAVCEAIKALEALL